MLKKFLELLLGTLMTGVLSYFKGKQDAENEKQLGILEYEFNVSMEGIKKLEDSIKNKDAISKLTDDELANKLRKPTNDTTN